MSNRVAPELRQGILVVTLAYVAAALAAWALVRGLPEDLHPLWKIAIADVGATLVVFGFSVTYDNSSMYDPYWSVAPLLIGPWLAVQPQAADAVGVRQGLVLALLFGWGIRLTFNWLRGWQGIRHEDWRYVEIRRTAGRRYWVTSLLGIHLMPTAMVFGGCLALWPALVVGTAPLGWIDGVALLLGVGAVACEALADRQLHEFRRNKPAPDAILDRGLWSWSRHPNYFGEIMLWWSMFAFGLAAAPNTWWPVVGPTAITLLFVFVSIPLIEQRMHARRPGYAAHCRRVSMLLPRPPRRLA
jgi:steroid 5-alpha reductase family enzyme